MAEVEVRKGRAATSAEPIETSADSLLSGRRLVIWRTALANAVANANACRVYISHSNSSQHRSRNHEVKIIGRASDIQIVRYFFGYLSIEIERLCKKAQKKKEISPGKTSANNFKLGATAAVAKRLKESRQEMRSQANKVAALVYLNQAEAEGR